MKREKNKFSYVWLGCLSLILVLCIVGVMGKKTYSASDDCYMTENGEVCLNKELEISGEYRIVKTAMGTLKEHFQGSFTFYAGNDNRQFGNIKVQNNVNDMSVLYDQEVVAYVIGSSSSDWVFREGYDESYLNINVLGAKVSSEENYDLFMRYVEPVNRCYYNKKADAFVWTNQNVGEVRKEYVTEAECENARVVVLKDSSGSITVDGVTTPHYYFGSKGDEFSVKEYYDALDNVVLTRDGYSLYCWILKSDDIDYGHDEVIKLESNITLIAHWREKLNVTFDSNGGTGTMPSQIFLDTVRQKINLNAFTKKGYVFKEWNTKPDGTGESYSDHQEILISSDLTLYAIWTDLFSIKEYKVDQDEKLIFVPVGTNSKNFEKNLVLGDKCSYDIEFPNNNLAYTGLELQIVDNNGDVYAKYTLVVLGDVTGDGELGTMDYINVYNHLDSSKLLNGFYAKAADINQDNDITTMDYIDIYNALGGN